MRISFAGILVGGFADVTTSFLIGLPLAAVARLLTLQGHPGLGAVAAETTWARMHAHPFIWSIELLVSLACSAFGGFVSAAIAGRGERLNGALSSWLCIGLGIALMPLGLNKDPWWLQVFFLLLSPMLGFSGGNLRLRQRMARDARLQATIQ